MMRAALGMQCGTESGVRVLAARQWPPGCGLDEFDVWAPDLAPSMSLTARRRNGMADSAFEREYAAELAGDAQRRELTRLRRLAASYGVVVCHGCEDGCRHRVLERLAYRSR